MSQPGTGTTFTCAICHQEDTLGPEDGFTSFDIPGFDDDDYVHQACAAGGAR